MVPDPEAHGNLKLVLFCYINNEKTLKLNFGFSESDGVSVTAKSLSAMSKGVLGICCGPNVSPVFVL